MPLESKGLKISERAPVSTALGPDGQLRTYQQLSEIAIVLLFYRGGW